jgi:16S rRNA (uracil1498-N3)-methyltransferase
VHRFYAPDFAGDGDVQLPDAEARHLARVLRLKPGDAVAIFDGRGREALARVEAVHAGKVMLRPTAPRQPASEPKVSLTLAQALLKSDKMERVISDAVMLGVSAVQPVLSRRTDVPQAALRAGGRQARWERTVIASVKQCGRAVVPLVLAPIDLSELLRTTPGRTRLMLVEPSAAGQGNVKSLLSLEAGIPAEAVIMIGPEGGWDRQEVDAAAESGVTLVSLGSRTLRADAAGAAAIAVLQYIWKDL